jgi:hypothetical protein
MTRALHNVGLGCAVVVALALVAGPAAGAAYSARKVQRWATSSQKSLARSGKLKPKAAKALVQRTVRGLKATGLPDNSAAFAALSEELQQALALLIGNAASLQLGGVDVQEVVAELESVVAALLPSSDGLPGTNPGGGDPSLPPVGGNTISITGTIRYYTFEGGFWAIRGSDGVTYDPYGLPPAFRVEGLPVALVAVIRNDLVGFHMAGPIIDIISLTPLP